MKRVAISMAAVVCLFGVTACEPPPPNNQSVAKVGTTPVNGTKPAMTPNGRYVAYVSHIGEIVPGFSPGHSNVYRLDRNTGVSVAVSVSPTGAGSYEDDYLYSGPETVDISDDGRYVMFTSKATNLTADVVTGSRHQVFVRDVVTGTTTLVSAAPGVTPNGEGRYAQISHNGQWVTFRSSSTNLGPADTNGANDVYRWSRATGAITRVSVGLDAANAPIEALGASGKAMPLDDGRVVFESRASNIIYDFNMTPSDFFLYLANPDTRAVKYLAPGYLDDVTPDGRYVVFEYGGVVIPPDTNSRGDVFVLDTVAKTTEYAVTAASGGPPATGAASGAISSNGRFVVTRSGTGIVPGDTSTLSGSYLRDRQTGKVYRVSRKPDGTPGTGASSILDIGISADGKLFSFDTPGANYITGASGSGTWAVVSRTPLP